LYVFGYRKPNQQEKSEGGEKGVFQRGTCFEKSPEIPGRQEFADAGSRILVEPALHNRFDPARLGIGQENESLRGAEAPDRVQQEVVQDLTFIPESTDLLAGVEQGL